MYIVFELCNIFLVLILSVRYDKTKILLISPVDALVRCNQQVSVNIIQGSSNTTQNGSANQPEDEKRLKGRAHFSGSSAIVEGEPFTATLWAGVEGFHLTVNGRHETSFAYREVSLCYVIRLHSLMFMSIG